MGSRGAKPSDALAGLGIVPKTRKYTATGGAVEGEVSELEQASREALAAAKARKRKPAGGWQKAKEAVNDAILVEFEKKTEGKSWQGEALADLRLVLSQMR